MKSPILCVGDCHFHNHKAFSTIVADGMTSRLDYALRAWGTAVEAGLKEGCKLLVFAGDMFHIRGHLRPSVYNAVYDMVARTAAQGLKLVMIPGNHDYENYYDNDTAIDKFGEIEDVHVLSRACPALTVDGWKIAGVPYHHNPGHFKKRYEEVCREAKPDVVLTHEYFDEYMPVEMGRRGISIEFLQEHMPKNAIVVNGHYHVPGYIAGSRVLDAGRLLPQSFADVNGGGYGCWMVRPGRDPKFVPIESPQFITINGFKKGDEKIVKGNYVRIEARTDKAAITIREKCEAAGALGVVANIVKDYSPHGGKTIKISSKEKMIGEYIDAVGGDYTARKADILALHKELCA